MWGPVHGAGGVEQSGQQAAATDSTSYNIERKIILTGITKRYASRKSWLISRCSLRRGVKYLYTIECILYVMYIYK
jgi:hypothetical protein